MAVAAGNGKTKGQALHGNHIVSRLPPSLYRYIFINNGRYGWAHDVAAIWSGGRHDSIVGPSFPRVPCKRRKRQIALGRHQRFRV